LIDVETGPFSTMKISFAVQLEEQVPTAPLALLSGTFKEKVTKAATMGADGLELMIVDPSSLDAARVREQLVEFGLAVPAVSSGAIRMATGLSLLHQDADKAKQAVARLQELVLFASSVGAPLVTIGGFRGLGRWAGEDGKRMLGEALTGVASTAHSNGVRIVIEPLNRYEADLLNTAAETLSFVESLGDPAIGLLLDTFHVNIEETSFTRPFAEAMAKGRLWHVHVADNTRRSPGTGVLDFGRLIAYLREVGYLGFLSGEMLPLPDPDAAAVNMVRHLRPLIDGRR
jgi:sugar phosphate isomerase/epimerase